MIGERINNHTVISEPYSLVYGGKPRRVIDVVCDCGNQTKLLYRPKSKAYPIGCDKCKSLIFKDRLKARKMRSSWEAMKRRCNDTCGRHYKYYMAMGITYCERWERFPNFYEDMQSTWFLGSQLDRFPNTRGNYEPSNCRWTTTGQQQRNKDSIMPESSVIEIRRLYATGEYTQLEIAKRYGVRDSAISRIVNNKRWKL